MMFELPECVVLAKQMNNVMQGKVVRNGRLGNSPHKFVWYNRSPEEFSQLTQGKTVGAAWSKGRWLFVPFDPGYVLVLGEFGGKAFYHQPGAKLPKKFHLNITFTDDFFFTVTTQMWGAIEFYESGKECEREYVKNMRPTPIEPTFTFEYFSNLIDTVATGKKRSVKGLLTQDQLIPGLGNSIAQDIMYCAHLNPKQNIADLSINQRRMLYDSICNMVQNIIKQGGRYDEYDLFGNRGDYVRLMDKNAVGQPCAECGSSVQKMSYLGGACYFCPTCQR